MIIALQNCFLSCALIRFVPASSFRNIRTTGSLVCQRYLVYMICQNPCPSLWIFIYVTLSKFATEIPKHESQNIHTKWTIIYHSVCLQVRQLPAMNQRAGKPPVVTPWSTESSPAAPAPDAPTPAAQPGFTGVSGSCVMCWMLITKLHWI